MRPAVPGEVSEPGCMRAAIDDVRPLSGAPVVVQGETRADHAAVDDPGGDHSQLAADGARHRLVEQPPALLEGSAAGRDESLVRESECLQVGVAVAATEVAHLLCQLEHAVPLARSLLQEHQHEGEVAVFA
jgi:hypothetical protein